MLFNKLFGKKKAKEVKEVNEAKKVEESLIRFKELAKALEEEAERYNKQIEENMNN